MRFDLDDFVGVVARGQKSEIGSAASEFGWTGHDRFARRDTFRHARAPARFRERPVQFKSQAADADDGISPETDGKHCRGPERPACAVRLCAPWPWPRARR